MEGESPESVIAQFVIPKRAYTVINASAIEAQAYADGIARPRIEANTRHAGGSNIRLTCRVPMVDRITVAITVATSLAERKHDAALVADLSIALASALKGRDEALHPRHLTRGDQGSTG